MIGRYLCGAWLMLLWAGPLSAFCWDSAGRRHGIEPELLYAMAQVESGLRARATGSNKDGSRDIGLMQINSFHLPRLAAQGITEQRLLEDPCLNVQVGATILAQFIERHGYGWAAVGAYNAGSAEDRQAIRERYARKVWRLYRVLGP
ncbi:transglycosylase SLT domain-containing protein [Pseudomonas gingeri]|uniref:Transglycosylase SLT domain-containing protein n=1 Tax=Pseudomonas gingeri TaxID=117681 RepID=A0A7Y8CHW4_9PSED|nr:transglycosylase SLT domain-containing protein [Pseudomonas gingeri]NWB27410.1 transglycosylase SLT domain-containing protein [Pseudomonas gingeri]NWC31593.1 transglycosylase SLT domain-containing protein [Pseudomonas gingeri]